MENVVFSSWGKEVIDNRQVKKGQAILHKDLAILRGFNGKQMSALIGWNGLIIWNPNINIVTLVDSYLKEAFQLSCGECDACNLGLKTMSQIHHRIIQGESNEEELEAIDRLSRWVKDTGKCNFGKTMMTPILDALQYYRRDYEPWVKSGGPDKVNPSFQYERVVTSPCIEACPVRMDVPGYVQMIKNNRVQEALSIINENCIFPGTVGRVCSHPCEEACVRAKVDLPVAIRGIKRYVADKAEDEGISGIDAIQMKGKDKVAVIGAGPAGLAAAYRLSRLGYKVTVFEKNNEPGGMAVLGIPDYRLPKRIIQREVMQIERAGILIKMGKIFGKDFGFGDLWSQDYKAIFIAIGAGKSKMIPIPGKEFSGVIGGIEFLRDVKSGKPIHVKDRVVVIGGGNVAVDCARTALRMGAKEVHLVCLESKQEMPASAMEISEALVENVILHASWGPGEIVGINGKVTGVVFQKCIAVFDEQRNFNPRCDIAKTTKISADMVILAVGQEPDLFFLGRDDRIRTTSVNTVEIEPDSLSTQHPGVFSGGDCVTGPATFIEAIAHGNRAAQKIDQYLRTGKFVESDKERLGEWIKKVDAQDQRSLGLFGKMSRQNPMTLHPEERKKGLTEVDLGMTEEAVMRETQRCLRCYRLMVLATEG